MYEKTKVENRTTEVITSICSVILPFLILFLPIFPQTIELKGLVLCIIITGSLFLFINRIDLWIGLAIASFTLIPAEAVGVFSGYYYSSPNKIINISITSYVVITLFTQLLIVFLLKKDCNLINIKLLALILVVFISIILSRGLTSGILSNKLLDNFILPIIFFVTIIFCLPTQKVESVLKILVYFILLNAGIAILEYSISSNLFYNQYYMKYNEWYQAIIGSHEWGVPYRSGACIGHPLALSSYIVLGIMLVQQTEKRISFKSLLYYTILLIALFTTNSRGGIISIALFFIYKLFRKSILKGTALLASIISCFTLLSGFTWYNNIFSRDSSGSSVGVRLSAISTFFKIPLSTLILGAGFNQSATVMALNTGSMQPVSNFEIGPLIILVEMGCITLLSIIVLVSYIIFSAKKYAVKNNNLSFFQDIFLILAILFINFCTYNSIGNSGTLNYLPWLLLGLLYVGSKNKKLF